MNPFVEKIVKSLLYRDGPTGSVENVLAWIKMRNNEVVVRINQVPFRSLSHWRFDDKTGNLCHDSGKFFSIEGIHVAVDDGERREWTQPIINQPEIGILGIITREIDGVLCFLLQAKIEPGNVNHVQLSPTLQATRSNYTQVHKGRRPKYLEYFRNAPQKNIILDQLQSEQGARFFRKRNRNIILKVDNDVPLSEDYIWLTLGQIKALMHVDNIVNMDTRTVLSGLRYHDSLCPVSEQIEKIVGACQISRMGREWFVSEQALTGRWMVDDILFWLSELKSRYELQVHSIPMCDVKDWNVTESEIVRQDRRYFRVLGVEVMINNREVSVWHQPLIEPMQEGLCAFIIKKIDGIYHFLVQAKIECGNFDVVEMAPTVQCLTGKYQDKGGVPPSFAEYVLTAPRARILYDARQSEEGGRFYHEQNRNLIVEADDAFPESVPENFFWLTLGQIKEFLRFNNYLNIQARSLVAALDYM
jgi:oxidase EvaA